MASLFELKPSDKKRFGKSIEKEGMEKLPITKGIFGLIGARGLMKKALKLPDSKGTTAKRMQSAANEDAMLIRKFQKIKESLLSQPDSPSRTHMLKTAEERMLKARKLIKKRLDFVKDNNKQ